MIGQEFRRLPVSRFREEAGIWMDWVAHEGGHIWLTRHGKHMAAVIPFYQLKMLEALLGRTESDKAVRLEQEYSRFRAAKTVQAHEERARLDAGGRIGGAGRTAKMQEALSRREDPWEEDGVLITTHPQKKRLVFGVKSGRVAAKAPVEPSRTERAGPSGGLNGRGPRED